MGSGSKSCGLSGTVCDRIHLWGSVFAGEAAKERGGGTDGAGGVQQCL